MTPFFIALQFLTRLKLVNQTEWTVEDFGKSVIAFPYVGLIIGLILALLYGVLSPFIPIMPLMLIIVVAEFLLTGGLHADGLMDTSDGLFSGCLLYTSRAERALWRVLDAGESVHESNLKYLNRLSDLCFIMCRVEEELGAE